MSKILTPNGGQPKKIVNMRNEPIENTAPESLKEMTARDRIVNALRRFADDIEKAPPEHDPEYVLVMPRFKSGQMPLMLLGTDMPQTLLVGVLTKLVTRMALEG